MIMFPYSCQLAKAYLTILFFPSEFPKGFSLLLSEFPLVVNNDLVMKCPDSALHVRAEQKGEFTFSKDRIPMPMQFSNTQDIFTALQTQD